MTDTRSFSTSGLRASPPPNSVLYETVLAGGKHWSFTMKAGTALRLIDIEGGANAGMLFYNPANLLERYNAPDTLKCQHTFKLTAGNCLYSDMGRIFCSITEDSMGWHDSVCGNLSARMVEERWGARDYQHDRNDWKQNGRDSFLVEAAKYGLGKRDLAANVNWFSKVAVEDDGTIAYVPDASKAGNHVELRFEMDTLVLMHTCPHPLNKAESYPWRPVGVEFRTSAPVPESDACRLSRPENARGFENNRLYHLCGC
ncbi:urea amidolyase associated protein UAAP1 [Terrihabitans rhizophilus]|uniref:Urea carboxylase-associated family protein n=1 Tax=Terrihabitans rhizophilus TaxID=3092662 RepID=A0ABU4RJA2_9HYPH|nr:urea amidolyase associated protein UAAP1 [Terrihabitans sp. PJ23]MDX6804897.1 urea carboxylase-associated family protein [Terrihabitans sp. PJ23]